MKLYLSSYHLGNQGTELASMALPNKKTAVIVNAWDGGLQDIERRKTGIQEEIQGLKSLGFIPEELDLRKYFGKEKKLEAKLEKFGLVWITGGNTFILRRAMKQSGFDKIITKMVRSNKIVYAGYSAAICVICPDLQGIDLCDYPNDIPEGYNPEVLWDGLGFVNYSIVPHYKSDHPESPMSDKTVEFLKERAIPYKTLHDGEVIIVDN